MEIKHLTVKVISLEMFLFQSNFFLSVDLEALTPTLTNEKPFDTNTFVLKRKERRKVNIPANENSFNDEIQSDLIHKQSPSDSHVPSRIIPTASMDPIRIMYKLIFVLLLL